MLKAVVAHLSTIQDIINHPLNRHSRFRAGWKYLSWNVGRRLIGAEYLLKLTDDVQLIVSNDENYSTLVYTQGLWDFADMMFLTHVLRPEDLFMDVGANVGGYSVLAARVAGAAVVAVEPVPETYAKLLRNLRLNNVMDQVSCINAGVAAAEGVLTFTTSKGGLNHVSTDARHGVEVPVTTLDVLTRARVPLVLKMDVEGYEKHVLAGGGGTLGSPELGAIIVELNGSGLRFGITDREVHDMICACGFRPHSYDVSSRTIKEIADFNTGSLNTLYLRPDASALQERVRSAKPVKVRGEVF